MYTSLKSQSHPSLELTVMEGSTFSKRNNSMGTSSDPVSVETQYFEIVTEESKDHWITQSPARYNPTSPRTQCPNNRNFRQRSVSLQNINNLSPKTSRKSSKKLPLPTVSRKPRVNAPRNSTNYSKVPSGNVTIRQSAGNNLIPKATQPKQYHVPSRSDHRRLYNVEEEEDHKSRIWRWLNDEEFDLNSQVSYEDTWEELPASHCVETAIRIVYSGD